MTAAKGMSIALIKVLIADDEAILCNGIKNAIDWDSLGAQVVATACDGEDALQGIRLHQPDICLLDVRMPFVDGLEVAKQYLAEKPDGIAIMITGYDEFAYAHSALNIGVFGYILKPVNETELLATVRKAIAKLRGIREDDETRKRGERLLQGNIKLLRDTFLQNRLFGKIDTDTFLADCPAHSVDIAPCSAMLLLRLQTERPEHSAPEPDALLSRAESLLSGTLEGFQPFFTVKTGAGTLAAVHSRDRDNTWLDIPTRLYPKLRHAEISAYIIQKDFDSVGEMPEIYAALEAELDKNTGLSPITNALKQYAEQGFRDPDICLKDFANQRHTTSSYLSRLFRREVGVAFVLYLSRLRIHKSLHYLKNPETRICEIAELCGYSSQHYYSESFRRIMGISPSEYRKSLRIE